MDSQTTALPAKQQSGMSVQAAPEPFFLSLPKGHRFCLLYAPADRHASARATVVFVHAFAEEMNKSRRMVALQAHALAADQCAVLQIDLLGCGDSAGLLSDATWEAWLADVAAASAWLGQRYPDAQRWLWGHRAGCLLAAEAASREAGPVHLLLWQPMLAGKTLVQQFLRLKAAAGLSDGQAAKSAMAALRAAVAAGQAVEVAGYPLPAALLQAMEVATLSRPAPATWLRCLEVSPRPEAELSPATAKLMQAWRDAGLDVQARVVQGPAFWQASEIETAPALLPATLAAMGLG